MAGPGVGGGGAVPDTGGITIDNLTESPSSISYFGLKTIDFVVGRPINNIYSFSGNISSPGIGVSSLVSLPDNTRFAIIQPLSTAITISHSVNSFGGLVIQGDQRITLAMSQRQLNQLAIGVSATTKIIIEAFDYEY